MSKPVPVAGPTPSITGAGVVRAGQSASFSASGAGLTNAAVIWSVNGLAGGTPAVGTISGAGTYTAPATPPTPNTVTVSCSSSANPVVTASANLAIENPAPLLLSGTAADDGNSQYVIDLMGSGFMPESAASFDGAPAPAKFFSAMHLRATIAQAAYNNSITAAIVSNPDPGAARSSPLAIALPPAPTLTMTGATELRAGSSATYTASSTGLASPAVIWSVNGDAGGSGPLGTISADGVYAAPQALPSPNVLTIGCTSLARPSLKAAFSVAVLNPKPVIQTTSATYDGGLGFTVDVSGSGFTAQSSVAFDGAPATSTLLSPGHLQATIRTAAYLGLSTVAVVSNPDPGAASSNSSQVGLPQGDVPRPPSPLAFQSLIGCNNPNIGKPSNDWGAGSTPLHEALNYQTQLVGAPAYSSNAIFWTSRENGPGQSVLMTGAFTSATKSVRVAFVPDGTLDWQSLAQNSRRAVPTIQQGTTGLSFQVPVDLPKGVYAFEIDDPSAAPTFGLANAPSMSWAMGVPSVSDPSHALQHSTYDCGAEPGGMLRIFGKNFVASDQVVFEAANGSISVLRPFTIDANSLAVTVPAGLAPGVYDAWVGGSPWSATSSPAAPINILAPRKYSIGYASCPRLVGDGTTDNARELQLCLDGNAPAPGSSQLIYFSFPVGIFSLSGAVTGHPGQALEGVSPALTKFVGRSVGPPPRAWFTVPKLFAMSNLSVSAPASPHLLASSDLATGSPLTSGDLYFSNVDFESTSDVFDNTEQMFALAGPNIQIYGSTFLAGATQAFDLAYADGAVVSGDQFIVNNSYVNLKDSQNVIFEGNHTHSTNGPGALGGAGMSIARSFNQHGPSALSQNIYVGYNSFTDMGTPNQQIIINDGGGAAYFGPVASSTADAVVLAADPSWDWVGTTNPEAAAVSVLKGTGVGQYRLVKSYTGRTISLDRPWTVPPDSTSTVIVSVYERNITVAHDTFTDTAGLTIQLSDTLDAVVEDNLLVNSGGGLQLWCSGPYGGPAGFGPVMNTDVLRNRISVGKGNLITSSASNNIAGIGIYDGYGCMISGLMVRGNVVNNTQTIYNTNGANGINANVIEDNLANPFAIPSIPGFLVQDNTPQ